MLLLPPISPLPIGLGSNRFRFRCDAGGGEMGMISCDEDGESGVGIVRVQTEEWKITTNHKSVESSGGSSARTLIPAIRRSGDDNELRF